MWQVKQNGEYIELKGTLDEFADLSLIETFPSPWKLDLSGISRINSIGSRNWIHFMLKNKSEVEIHNASIPFMEQVLLISSMVGDDASPDVLKSFHLEYYCNSCAFEFSAIKNIKSDLQTEPCPKCNNTAKIDDKLADIDKSFPKVS